jgi:hypothetical protein
MVARSFHEADGEDLNGSRCRAIRRVTMPADAPHRLLSTLWNRGGTLTWPLDHIHIRSSYLRAGPQLLSKITPRKSLQEELWSVN